MLTEEDYFDAPYYLYEHVHKCTNCTHMNIGCDGRE